MIIDNELLFADGTWAPTATGDNISTNQWDSSPYGGTPTPNAGRDLGLGEPMWMVVTVKTAVTSAGAATVDFRLRTDTASSGVASPVDLVSTGAIAKATLVAGFQRALRLPSNTPANIYKKWLMCNANIGTAVLTAGAFHVALVKDLQSNIKYASGFNLDS